MKQLFYGQESEMKQSGWLGVMLEGRGSCGINYPPGNPGIVRVTIQLIVRGSYRCNPGTADKKSL